MRQGYGGGSPYGAGSSQYPPQQGGPPQVIYSETAGSILVSVSVRFRFRFDVGIDVGVDVSFSFGSALFGFVRCCFTRLKVLTLRNVVKYSAVS